MSKKGKEIVKKNNIIITSNLSSIFKTNNIFEEVPVEVNGQIYPVRVLLDDKRKPWFVCIDIANVIDYDYPKNAIGIVRDYQRLTYKEFKERFGNEDRLYPNTIDRQTNIINIEGVEQILNNNRVCSLDRIYEICDIFGVRYHNYKKITKEQEHICAIKRAFKSENTITQYKIKIYRVDLIFIDFKLIIECDEFNHSNRDIEYEQKRTEIIEELGYSFIRFNPDEIDLSILDVINDINIFIKGWHAKVNNEIKKENIELKRTNEKINYIFNPCRGIEKN